MDFFDEFHHPDEFTVDGRRPLPVFQASYNVVIFSAVFPNYPPRFPYT
jgi:hypothetical protein